jgi:hypothetical protein
MGASHSNVFLNDELSASHPHVAVKLIPEGASQSPNYNPAIAKVGDVIANQSPGQSSGQSSGCSPGTKQHVSPNDESGETSNESPSADSLEDPNGIPDEGNHASYEHTSLEGSLSKYVSLNVGSGRSAIFQRPKECLVPDSEICQTWNRCRSTGDDTDFCSQFVPTNYYSCLKEAIMKSLHYSCVWDCPRLSSCRPSWEIICVDLETIEGQFGRLSLSYPSREDQYSCFLKNKLSCVYKPSVRNYLLSQCSSDKEVIIERYASTIQYLVGVLASSLQ